MTTTATTPLSTVIGVFPSYEQAEKTIDELRSHKFSYEHIRIVERGKGGFTDTLKGLFTGQAQVASSATDDLMKMGMPDYEAQYYQRELDSNNVLLLINADDRPEEAFNIMRQNGAFDLHSRLRMPTENGKVSVPDTNGSQASSDQNAPSSTPASDTNRSWANANQNTPARDTEDNEPSTSDTNLARQRDESQIPPIPADNVDVKPADEHEEAPSPPTPDRREEEEAPDH